MSQVGELQTLDPPNVDIESGKITDQILAGKNVFIYSRDPVEIGRICLAEIIECVLNRNEKLLIVAKEASFPAASNYPSMGNLIGLEFERQKELLLTFPSCIVADFIQTKIHYSILKSFVTTVIFFNVNSLMNADKGGVVERFILTEFSDCQKILVLTEENVFLTKRMPNSFIFDDFFPRNVPQESQNASFHTHTDQLAILPITKHILLTHDSKPITAVTLDAAGSRLFTAGHDFSLKIWDFHGMSSKLKNFRECRPCGEYRIHQLAFSSLNERLLVISDSPQANLLTKDGHSVGEYARGDMYLHDMKQTKGHTSSLTSADWHPTTKDIFLTSSFDGTVRIWNALDFSRQKDVIHVRGKSKQKSSVTTAKFDLNASSIITGSNDGSLRLYSMGKAFNRPTLEVLGAHKTGCDITHVAISPNSPHLIATRSMDDTMKLWDIRSLSSGPLHVFDGLPTLYQETCSSFSPDGKFLITGISNGTNREKSGCVNIYQADSQFSLVKSIDTGNTGSIVSLWHPRLNQLICGLGDGTVRIYYDETLSEKGAKMCLTASTRSQYMPVSSIDFEGCADSIGLGKIYTPHSISMYDEHRTSAVALKRKMLRNPLLSKRPEPPMVGQGSDGKIGTNVTASIMKGLIKQDTLNEDSRDVLLSYAKVAEEEPFWVTPAYRYTQPHPIFSLDDEENDTDKHSRKTRKLPDPSLEKSGPK